MNLQQLSYYISPELVPLYTNNGWDMVDAGQGENAGLFRVSTSAPMMGASAFHPQSLNCKRVYLVQRGVINRPLGKFIGARISNAVRMDYMGSSEFEFYALPRSLRRVQASHFAYNLKKSDDISVKEEDRTFSLRVYSRFSGTELQTYMEMLLRLQANKMQLKEASHFSKVRPTAGSTDFWWDIENDAFWSYDKNFMSRLSGHLEASFALMDEKASTA